MKIYQVSLYIGSNTAAHWHYADFEQAKKDAENRVKTLNRSNLNYSVALYPMTANKERGRFECEKAVIKWVKNGGEIKVIL